MNTINISLNLHNQTVLPLLTILANTFHHDPFVAVGIGSLTSVLRHPNRLEGALENDMMS